MKDWTTNILVQPPEEPGGEGGVKICDRLIFQTVTDLHTTNLTLPFQLPIELHWLKMFGHWTFDNLTNFYNI